MQEGGTGLLTGISGHPMQMCIRSPPPQPLHDACKSEKEYLAVEGAAHVKSAMVYGPAYWDKVFRFIGLSSYPIGTILISDVGSAAGGFVGTGTVTS